MKIAILTRRNDHLSLRIYRENIERELSSLNVTFIPFEEKGPLPLICDLVWDPGLGMRRVPGILEASKVPVAATVHGVRAFSLSAQELSRSWKERVELFILKKQLLSDWERLGKKVAAVIAVSQFGATELASAFGLPKNVLHPIHHGIDHSVFSPTGEKVHGEGGPYMLNVSLYTPVKNVDRLFSAYAALPSEGRPSLVAVLPGYAEKKRPQGIRVIKERLTQERLADLYRNALCTVLPSLRESFCFPVLEAMACGCPVITANITGCAEVAGDAAILVDPRSVDEISQAMKRLIKNSSLRETLRQEGIARAAQFTWQKSAQDHLNVFRNVLDRTI
jgi:glycosyltransferase involved in cell wall biosynthesis